MALADALVGALPGRRPDSRTRPLLELGRRQLNSLAEYEQAREEDDITRSIERLIPRMGREPEQVTPQTALPPLAQVNPLTGPRLVTQRNAEEQRQLVDAAGRGAIGPQVDRRQAGLFAALALLGTGVGAITGGSGVGEGIARGLTGGARMGAERLDADMRAERAAFMDELRREQQRLEQQQQRQEERAYEGYLYQRGRRDALQDEQRRGEAARGELEARHGYDVALQNLRGKQALEEIKVRGRYDIEQARIREAGLAERNRAAIEGGRYGSRTTPKPDSTLLRMMGERASLSALPDDYIDRRTLKTKSELLTEKDAQIQARARALEQMAPETVPPSLRTRQPDVAPPPAGINPGTNMHGAWNAVQRLQPGTEQELEQFLGQFVVSGALTDAEADRIHNAYVRGQ